MTIGELNRKISSLDESLKKDCAKIITETAREYFMERLDNKTYDALVESGNLSANIRAAMFFRFVRPHHRTSSRNKRLLGRGYSYRVRRRHFMCDDRELLDLIDKRIDQYVSYKQRKNKKRKKRPC